jgi:hypothetical protein
MDAVWPIDNRILFMIEGMGQGGLGGCNWGDGFQTSGSSQLNGVNAQNPNPFFQALMGRPYLHHVSVNTHTHTHTFPSHHFSLPSSLSLSPSLSRTHQPFKPHLCPALHPLPSPLLPLSPSPPQVVISPHVYGPGVTHSSTRYSGAGLWQRMTQCFGYLTKAGYTYNNVTKRFPVCVGEVGSKFQLAGDIQVRGARALRGSEPGSKNLSSSLVLQIPSISPPSFPSLPLHLCSL